MLIIKNCNGNIKTKTNQELWWHHQYHEVKRSIDELHKVPYIGQPREGLENFKNGEKKRKENVIAHNSFLAKGAKGK